MCGRSSSRTSTRSSHGRPSSQSEYTGTEPVLNLVVGTSGDRKALQFHNEDNTTAWGSFEFALGSIDKPGLAMGSGDAGA